MEIKNIGGNMLELGIATAVLFLTFWFYRDDFRNW